MRILFIGCVESSKMLLKCLIRAGYEICGVVTKKEPGINSDFCDLTGICIENQIPLKYVMNVNDEDSVVFIKAVNPDAIYCFGWSQLIKSEVLAIPSKGAYGFHPAELPYNRGRHPVIWALVLGMKKTAVSFFLMNEKADEGKIIAQQQIDISYEDDARSLYDKLMQVAEEQVLDFTKKLANGEVLEVVVENRGGNAWRRRGRADGVIDWRMSGQAIYNLVRGLTRPYVGAEFVHDGVSVKVWKAEELKMEHLENIEYGKVIKVNSDTDYLIKAYDNVIHVLESDPVHLQEGEYL